VDKTALVEDEIALGREAAKGLHEDPSIDLRAALWLYVSAAGEWRLFIATPLVDTDGPKKTYAAIQKALGRLDLSGRLPLWRISAISPADPFVKLMRKLVRIKFGSGSVRLTNSRINNTLIEDAYVYLMQ